MFLVLGTDCPDYYEYEVAVIEITPSLLNDIQNLALAYVSAATQVAATGRSTASLRVFDGNCRFYKLPEPVRADDDPPEPPEGWSVSATHPCPDQDAMRTELDVMVVMHDGVYWESVSKWGEHRDTVFTERVDLTMLRAALGDED